MTGYEKLLASGFPISWNLLRTGLRRQLLSRADLQAHACDQLGLQSGDTGYLVFLLFDGDPTNNIQIDSLLERLAAGERTADGRDDLTRQSLAERTWNVVVMRDWLGNWPREGSAYTSDDYEYWVYDYRDYLPFPDVCDLDSPGYGSNSPGFEGILASVGTWMNEEETAIRRTQEDLTAPSTEVAARHPEVRLRGLVQIANGFTVDEGRLKAG